MQGLLAGAGWATYVWWLAGRRVTLQTRYFLFICPQCVISTFRPGDTEKPSLRVQVHLGRGEAPPPERQLSREPPSDPGAGRSGAAAGLPKPWGGNSARGPPHPHRRLLPQKCHGQRLETVLKDKRDDVGSAKTLCFLQDYF